MVGQISLMSAIALMPENAVAAPPWPSFHSRRGMPNDQDLRISLPWLLASMGRTVRTPNTSLRYFVRLEMLHVHDTSQPLRKVRAFQSSEGGIMISPHESDIRNAALEDAAKVADEFECSLADYGGSVGIAAAIRALKSDHAPVPAPKPFTFADPARQREWERQRREGE
jgi:hypothetical protein